MAFDLATAPFSRGLFLGDYQALTSANNVFVSVYVRTNSGDTANRNDVFAVPMRSLPLAAAPGARTFRAQPSLSVAPPDAEFRRRQRFEPRLLRSRLFWPLRPSNR